MKASGCAVSQVSNHSKYPMDEKVAETRQQLNDVMEVMRSNLEKMAIRSDRLENLACRAEVLDLSAAEFHKGAKEIHAKHYWKAHFYKYLLSGIFVMCAISGLYAFFT